MAFTSTVVVETVGTTEHDMVTDAAYSSSTMQAAARFSSVIDVSAMTASEEYRFRVYSDDGTTVSVVWEATRIGAQNEPVRTPEFMLNEWAITADKIAGTDRSLRCITLSEDSASASAPSAATIADAVWDEARAGHVAAGSFGEGVVTNSIASGAITASVIATDAIDADAIADNAINAAAIASGAITSAKIADGAITVLTFATGAINSGTFAVGAINADALAADAVTEIQSGLATAAALTAVDDLLDTEIAAIIATQGTHTSTLAGLALSTQVDALEAAAAAIEADTQDIQSRLPAALVSGRIDASVGAVAANAITAASIATDASAEIADAVWDEALAGHVAGGSAGAALSAASAPTAGDVAAAVWAAASEAAETYGDQLRLMVAALVGKATVQDDDGSYAFRDAADSKNRISGTRTATARAVSTRDGT